MENTKIMQKLFRLLFAATLIFLIAGCSQKPKFDLYEGESLSIAVLGTKPEVEEKQIKFREISFNHFNDQEVKKYDAVFIMQENLSEAAKKNYADLYLNSRVPFFFIGHSNTGEHPFVGENIEYEIAKETNRNGYYASGFLSMNKGEQKTWQYGLYNDEVTEENIKAVFSKIFITIEENAGI